MMDPYNLAICFGPTLVPIPADRDQVQFQNLVNELIKNFIIFHEDIFPTDGQGAVYEKYISVEPDDVQEYGNEESSLAEEDDLESEVTEDGENLLEQVISLQLRDMLYTEKGCLFSFPPLLILTDINLFLIVYQH